MLVNRDPFAREELHKQREYVTSRACDWCGGVKKTATGRHYLYVYRTMTDDGTTHIHNGAFCDKTCHDSYHGR
jgi:hypothetical protein